MLDPHVVSAQRESRHVPGGEVVGKRGLQRRVDEDAVVDAHAGLFRELRARDDAGADDEDIGVDALAALQHERVAVELRRLFAQMELHAPGRVQRLDETTEFRPERAFQRHGVGCDHVDIEAAFAQCARRFHPDEAGADQCDRTRLPAGRDDRPRIRKRGAT